MRGLFQFLNSVAQTLARGKATCGANRSAAFGLQPRLELLEDRMVPATVSLGAAADFGVLGLVGTQITNSNVTVNGNEGVSAGGKLTNMAPSTITGNVYEYASGEYAGPGKLFGSVVIDATLLPEADADALSAASLAAALAPNQTFSTISSATTVTGNGGLNVIAINGDIKNSLILTGTASDVFIVNVSGSLSLGGSATLGLAGGVTADHVLYNFTGASGTISTHVGNVLNGTLLAPKYSFSLDGVFNGEIIGGGKSITLLSGARVNQFSFNPPAAGTASLSGFVYNDANNDGLFDDGDSGLGGVTITLTGTDDQGHAVELTTTTDANGFYQFTGLRAGKYTLTESDVPTLNHNQSNVGTVDGNSDGVAGTAQITEIDLLGGNNGLDYDFGEVNIGS
jgi:hypothetical protein